MVTVGDTTSSSLAAEKGSGGGGVLMESPWLMQSFYQVGSLMSSNNSGERRSQGSQTDDREEIYRREFIRGANVIAEEDADTPSCSSSSFLSSLTVSEAGGQVNDGATQPVEAAATATSVAATECNGLRNRITPTTIIRCLICLTSLLLAALALTGYYVQQLYRDSKQLSRESQQWQDAYYDVILQQTQDEKAAELIDSCYLKVSLGECGKHFVESQTKGLHDILQVIDDYVMKPILPILDPDNLLAVLGGACPNYANSVGGGTSRTIPIGEESDAPATGTGPTDAGSGGQAQQQQPQQNEGGQRNDDDVSLLRSYVVHGASRLFAAIERLLSVVVDSLTYILQTMSAVAKEVLQRPPLFIQQKV